MMRTPPLRYRTTNSSLSFEANAQAAALDRRGLDCVTVANGGWLPEVEAGQLHQCRWAAGDYYDEACESPPRSCLIFSPLLY